MVSTSLNNTSSFNKSLPSAFKSNQSVKPKSALPVEMLNALDAIQGLNLKIEICGTWIWIFGADSSHETPLRKANFKWSYQRGCWYLCPPMKDAKAKNNTRSNCQPWGMNKVRKVFGSKVVQL